LIPNPMYMLKIWLEYVPKNAIFSSPRPDRADILNKSPKLLPIETITTERKV